MNIGIWKSKEKAFKSGQLIHIILRRSAFIEEAGSMIEFVNESDAFEPIKEGTVYSTQDIDFVYGKIYINGLGLSLQQKTHLAFNSGYNSLSDFIHDMPPEYKGIIIHWTKFKY